jgi:hypothetical protein
MGYGPPVRSAPHGHDQDDQGHAQHPCGEDEEPVQQASENTLRDLGVVGSAGQHALLVEDAAPFNPGSPVTGDYASPFKLTGTIRSVTVNVSAELILRPRSRTAHAHGRRYAIG